MAIGRLVGISLWVVQFVALHTAAAAFERADYCSGVCQCLGERPRTCTPAECAEQPGVVYTDDFCAVFKELDRRGLDAESPWGRRVYGSLGQKRRVTYELAGTLPLPPDALRFLIADVPFAAQLINAYQETAYTARYIDRARRQFRGNNGRNMQGTFRLVAQDTEQLHSAYFGYGSTKVLMWELYGVALVLLDLAAADGGRTAYRFRSIVFPANGLIESVLDFFLFRRVVTGKVGDIIANIEHAAGEFHRGSLGPIAAYRPLTTAAAQAKLAAFRTVLNSAAVAE